MIDIRSMLHNVSSLEELQKFKELLPFLSGQGYSEEVSTLNDDMNKKEYELKKQLVMKIHPYSIISRTRTKNGKPYDFFQTQYDKEGHQFRCATMEALIEKLYVVYFGEPKKPETIASVYEKWLAYKETETRSSDMTIYRIKTDWKKYIEGTELAGMEIRKIRSSDLKKQFRKWSLTMKKKCFTNVRSILNGIFSYAIDNDIIEIDVCNPIKIKDLEFEPEESHYTEVYTTEEREKLLNYLENLSEKDIYSLAVRLCFCFDCRIGELRGLKWCDYITDKYEHPMMYFRRQVVERTDRDGHRRTVELDHTKAKSADGDRLEPVSPRAQKVLEEIRELVPDGKYILVNRAGNSIYPNRFNEKLKGYCEAVGIDYHSSHRIRNYSITEQLKVNPDLDQAKYNSGHLQSSTTLAYVRRAKTARQNYHDWNLVHN